MVLEENWSLIFNSNRIDVFWAVQTVHAKKERGSIDMEKAEVLSEFFTFAFTGSQISHISCVPELLGRGWENGVPPILRAGQA